MLDPAAERDSFAEGVLVGRLREAIGRLNPDMPEEAREEALRKVLRVATSSLVRSNRAFHQMLRDGVEVEYSRPVRNQSRSMERFGRRASDCQRDHP